MNRRRKTSEPGLVAIDALHPRAVGPVDEIDRARALDDARRQLEGAPGDGAAVAGDERAVGVVAVLRVLGAGDGGDRVDAGATAQRRLAEAGARTPKAITALLSPGTAVKQHAQSQI